MKRRVFLGLPVILGILFYIWYIFHASDNVAYSDYIRLINSYLPDVTNPAKFFVPDILTRVPITYLGRIINVKLFGYNAYFDMILGVLSLGAGAAVLALVLTARVRDRMHESGVLLSLGVPRGRIVEVYGPESSGKTTLARLIPRFWDPVSGSVRMNGTEFPQMASGEVLSRVAVVFQDSMLLRASIADNIRLGRPGATDEQVQAAARQAQIHDRVMELPQGYDTVLGSEGSDLSGGEAQRVAIARGIVQDAPILVLDEATAHADPENETAIQKALNALAKGRTTVVIAHRLDTIVHADQILVLVGGKVVERGVHEELLAADGHYAALWRSQQVDALEKALLVEGAAMRGAAAGPQEADGEAEPNGADSRESEER
mgnify:CR=1 FL=1